jgi:hypothetical protein
MRALVLASLLTAATCAASRGTAAEAWNVSDQPELKQVLENARDLAIESLGICFARVAQTFLSNATRILIYPAGA